MKLNRKEKRQQSKVNRKEGIKVNKKDRSIRLKVRSYWCVVRIRRCKERLETETLLKYIVVKKSKESGEVPSVGNDTSVHATAGERWKPDKLRS